MAEVAFKDELLDAQFVRTVGTAPYGGADIGECLAAAAQVDGLDLGSWYSAWTSLAERVWALAEDAAADGQAETARSAYLRASNYFRTAGVMLMAAPLDARLVRSNERQTKAFRRGAELLDAPAEVIEIPFENTTLPGYFFPAPGRSGPGPLLILVGGYDGTAEELYFLSGAAASARGYHVLAFDGPGQGSALIELGLVLRPDWETVIAPVVDWAIERADVDPERIALVGLSLGAHLAPRAASAEHRLAACAADCGSFDLYASALERIPPPLVAGLDGSSRWKAAVLGAVLRILARKPTAGWALRRGQLVHGVGSPMAYLRSLREYSLDGLAGKITCPTFVNNADADDIGASAPRLAAELTCDHEFVAFTSAEGAGDHCEAGARTLYHARLFAWLDPILHPHRSADSDRCP